MKSKKINYNFSAIQIIEDNLGVQSIQNLLKKDFGINSSNPSFFNNPNFIKNYKSWTEEKKSKFIKTIGGVVYFKKVKNYLDDIINIGETK